MAVEGGRAFAQMDCGWYGSGFAIAIHCITLSFAALLTVCWVSFITFLFYVGLRSNSFEYTTQRAMSIALCADDG